MTPRRLPILAALLLLAGCQPSASEGVRQLRPDTFQISRAGADSLSLRFGVREQADHFCEARKLHAMPVDTDYSESFFQMTFRCLDSGDPEFGGRGPDSAPAARHKFGGTTLRY